jgi:hypothetical protein
VEAHLRGCAGCERFGGALGRQQIRTGLAPDVAERLVRAPDPSPG